MPNISILWDFDGTLTPSDSTSEVIKAIGSGSSEKFWKEIKNLRGDNIEESKWEHILASDAPIWMYALSRMAHEKKIPLNKEFFKKFVAPKVELYPNVVTFLKEVKDIEKLDDFKKQNIKIDHFIISAGLKELIEVIIPKDLIKWIFGSRYTVFYPELDSKKEPESIPVFCMDETMKTRSIFEIAKGSFLNQDTPVNRRVKNLTYPFSNMVYIGDGPTDIPALALIRDRGGVGVILYDKGKPKEDTKKRLKEMSSDSRSNFITAADFSTKGELFKFIKAHCIRVSQFYKASNIDLVLE